MFQGKVFAKMVESLTANPEDDLRVLNHGCVNKVIKRILIYFRNRQFERFCKYDMITIYLEIIGTII